MLGWVREKFKNMQTKWLPPPTKSKQSVVLLENEASGFVVCEFEDHKEQVISDSMWRVFIEKKQTPKDQFQVLFSIIKGINPHLRKDLWILFAKVESKRSQLGIHHYRDLLGQCPEQAVYKQIDLDIPRTFRKDDLRRLNYQETVSGLELYLEAMVRRVLMAYAVEDRELGYTQGMSYFVFQLVSTLIRDRCNQVEDVEELVFWVLRYTMIDHDYRAMFTQGMPGVFQEITKLQIAMQKRCPELLSKIENNGLDLYCLFTGYYMTAFNAGGPGLELASRITDLFLLIGPQVINSLVLRLLDNSLSVLMQIEGVQELANYIKGDLMKEMELLLLEQVKEASNLVSLGLSPWQKTLRVSL